MKKKIATFCFFLVKILPTSDQFNIIMFHNMYVKHKPSNLGHRVGVIKIVIVINCNLITFSKSICM